MAQTPNLFISSCTEHIPHLTLSLLAPSVKSYHDHETAFPPYAHSNIFLSFIHIWRSFAGYLVFFSFPAQCFPRSIVPDGVDIWEFWVHHLPVASRPRRNDLMTERGHNIMNFEASIFSFLFFLSVHVGQKCFSLIIPFGQLRCISDPPRYDR